MYTYEEVVDKMYMSINKELMALKRQNIARYEIEIIHDAKNMLYNVYYDEWELSSGRKKSCRVAVSYEICEDYVIQMFVELIVKKIEMQMSVSAADIAWMTANPNDFIFGHDYEYEYGAYIPSV